MPPNTESEPEHRRGPLRSLGPAIIVGSVVLGPGTILTSSRVGCDHGYGLLWVVALAALMMIGMTALSARLGATLDGSLGDELARRAGRPFTALVGGVLFAVVACFQFSNNIGVLAAIEPLGLTSGIWSSLLLVVLNLGVAAALFGLRRLYLPVERLMKVLVALMILGFVGNLVLARPSLPTAASGLLPRLPEGMAAQLLPQRQGNRVVDPLLPVMGLIATTFSVAAAFFQCYLVRQKGWTRAHLRHGLIDTVVGISILGALTMVIMMTAAAVLHGNVAGSELHSIADIARVLEPLFGPGAKVVFCVGLLAGAFSSFLGNVMIGGTVLSDSLGLGADIDRRAPKVFTALALAIGMVVALVVQRTGQRPVQLVIFAQALTVLGFPLLAGVLLFLSQRGRAPLWLLVLGGFGFLTVLTLAVRMIVQLWL